MRSRTVPKWKGKFQNLTELNEDDERSNRQQQKQRQRSKRSIFSNKEGTDDLKPTAGWLDEHLYGPLRIHIHFDESISQSLSPEDSEHVQKRLLPEAVKYFTEALEVRSSLEPVRLHRLCAGGTLTEAKWDFKELFVKLSHELFVGLAELPPAHNKLRIENDGWPPSDPNAGYCFGNCLNDTKCGDARVPEEHLFGCIECNGSLLDFNKCRRCSADGQGARNADFILYVSANDTDRCNKSETTEAYATHCQLETILDRPIAGHMNLCPRAVSSAMIHYERLLSTVKHEILHALGFSPSLYAFFRTKDGTPRTKRRTGIGGMPALGITEDYHYKWSNQTVRPVVRRNWWTRNQTISHTVQLMVTEEVKKEVRRHFNCPTLEGAELENQGGVGTALSHWEKRIFENEAMTGASTQNPVFSRLTLAAMEDTGWYRANYSKAEYLGWGSGLGCEFVLKSCGEWIQKRMARNQSVAPFCSIPKNAKAGSARTTCIEDHSSMALCNFQKFPKPIPSEYQYWEQIPEIEEKEDDTGVSHYGGSVEFADYCPYNQEYIVDRTDKDSRCDIVSNRPSDKHLVALETYGPSSKEGQTIRLHQSVAGRVHTGIVLCPPCAVLCDEPKKQFTCLPPADPPLEVGDPPSTITAQSNFLVCTAAKHYSFLKALPSVLLVSTIIILRYYRGFHVGPF